MSTRALPGGTGVAPQGDLLHRIVAMTAAVLAAIGEGLRATAAFQAHRGEGDEAAAAAAKAVLFERR